MNSPAQLDPFPDAFSDLVPASAPAPSLVSLATPGDFVQGYGLRENPFADSVSPAFFFRTARHAEAFSSLMLAADFNTSLGMLTGPSGTGKTLVSQLLLQHLDAQKYRTALVLVTPGLSKTGLLREILAELEIALPVGITRVQDLVKQLSNHVIALHEEGRRLVLIIDECHFLSADCLHIVRTITNLEIPERKLVTCLLLGESRFLPRLERPGYESLRNRLYFREELQPLTLEETGQYLAFRLMTAGRLAPLFTEAAVAALRENSGGIPRSLNRLAMLSLMQGSRTGQALVDEPSVQAAAARG